MVTPVVETIDSTKADWSLWYLFERWTTLDDWIALWPQMNPMDREVFHLEWTGIVGSHMDILKFYEPRFTPAQEQKWQELLMLVAQKQPTLNKMLST